MPNLCNFDFKITGQIKSIARFIRAATVNYSGKPEDPEHFYRVFNFIVTNVEPINGDLWTITAYGDCAWSVVSCFCEDGYPEIDDITLLKIAKEENLIIEVYSTEIGMCFSEHILVTKNGYYVNDCEDYYELDKDVPLDEFNKLTGHEWTQDQLDNYFKKEDYYIVEPWSFDFYDHEKIMEELK